MDATGATGQAASSEMTPQLRAYATVLALLIAAMLALLAVQR